MDHFLFALLVLQQQLSAMYVSFIEYSRSCLMYLSPAICEKYVVWMYLSPTSLVGHLMVNKFSFSLLSLRRYLVSFDTMSAVSKSNKYEICHQKIITLLTNEKHVLMDSYFCTHISYLLNFVMDDIILFDTKSFFLIFT